MMMMVMILMMMIDDDDDDDDADDDDGDDSDDDDDGDDSDDDDDDGDSDGDGDDDDDDDDTNVFENCLCPPNGHFKRDDSPMDFGAFPQIFLWIWKHHCSSTNLTWDVNVQSPISIKYHITWFCYYPHMYIYISCIFVYINISILICV